MLSHSPLSTAPRFGAILLKELSFRQGYSQHDVTVARFQVTEEDKTEFKSLLRDNSDEIRVEVCDIQSGGLDYKFRVNYQNLDAHTRWVGGNSSKGQGERLKQFPERKFYNKVRKLLTQAPLAESVKAALIGQLEAHSGRSGPHGRLKSN
jgi:hypothetical protein